MLLDRNRADGEPYYASEVDVYLNGKKQSYCFQAQTGKRGYIVRALLKNGKMYRATKKMERYDGIAVERIEGTVTAR